MADFCQNPKLQHSYLTLGDILMQYNSTFILKWIGKGNYYNYNNE